MRLETRAWEIADTVGEVEEHMLREIAESEHSLEEEESSLSHGLEDQATRYNSYEVGSIICAIKARVFTN